MIKNSWILITDERRVGGMLNAVNSISEQVTGVVVGSKQLLKSVLSIGFNKILYFEVPDEIPAEAFAQSVSARAQSDNPELIVCNDAAASRVLAGAIAGALNAQVVSEVTEFNLNNDELVITQEIAHGKALEDYLFKVPVVAIFVGSDAEMNADTESNVEKVDAEHDNCRVVGVADVGRSALADSQRVVGVGAGVQSKSDLSMIEELVDALDAETACTLPLCDDMHWYSSERVLGSSHNIAAPELYVAVGISGSPNHTSGFRDAKVVVSINSDPDAEIFKVSDYGIVGDLYKIVPELTKAIS